MRTFRSFIVVLAVAIVLSPTWVSAQTPPAGAPAVAPPAAKEQTPVPAAAQCGATACCTQCNQTAPPTRVVATVVLPKGSTLIPNDVLKQMIEAMSKQPAPQPGADLDTIVAALNKGRNGEAKFTVAEFKALLEMMSQSGIGGVNTNAEKDQLLQALIEATKEQTAAIKAQTAVVQAGVTEQKHNDKWVGIRDWIHIGLQAASVSAEWKIAHDGPASANASAAASAVAVAP
jgi:hypothetical protein